LVRGNQATKPFVTIGVTTYKRHDLLRQTLNSVLAQTFNDYEVIVGNDYTGEVLTCEMLGINDPRIRIVNHPHNLREVGNMNALLELSTGRYFTWLFDDDLYEPDFLQTAHDCLAKKGFPTAFFCSYKVIMGDDEFKPQHIQQNTINEFTGREFIRWYSIFRTKLFPTYGLFDALAIKNKLGGFEELGDSAIGLYSEQLFLVKCALLDSIVYVDVPYYVYRQHEGSWSESTTDLKYYQTAGQKFIRRGSEVLHHPSLITDYSENLLKVCGLHLVEFAFKSGRHAYYIPESAQKDFGIRAALTTIVKHWRESWETRKLYKSLGGDVSFGNLLVFIKIMLFCNYSLIIHLSGYLFRREKN
jgi:glycosyltransferase involved in cell wall biosynthesis